MTAASRILRTLFQVVLAVGAAIPAAVALLDLSAETTAKVVGIAGATVVIVTAIQNALEAKRLVPTMLGRRDAVNLAERLLPYDPEPSTRDRGAVDLATINTICLVILAALAVGWAFGEVPF